MRNPFEIVKDSSIWQRPSSMDAINRVNALMYFGIVRSVHNHETTNELRYIVEIKYKNETIYANCQILRRFGGVYNYEDQVARGYTFNAATLKQSDLNAKAGDVVLVGYIGGQEHAGIILGGLTHPARGDFLDSTLGPQYRSEFNGVETFINEDGEYTLTFKGQPTNLAALTEEPSSEIVAPEYDLDVGSSFFMFDKVGSVFLSDNATENTQLLRIVKPDGTLEILSGKISLKMTKSEESVVLNCKTTEIDSTDSITLNTKAYEANATDHAKYTTPLMTIDSPDIRLGGADAVEYLILGTTFRAEQMTMDSAMISGFTALGGALTTVGAQLSVAGADPTFVGVAGSAAAAIAAAGAAIAGATAAITALAAAIQSFESAGAATDFLSVISKTK